MLHDGDLLQIGYVAVRPASSAPGDVEVTQRHALALPLTGVFAKHDAPHHEALSRAACATSGFAA